MKSLTIYRICRSELIDVPEFGVCGCYENAELEAIVETLKFS